MTAGNALIAWRWISDVDARWERSVALTLLLGEVALVATADDDVALRLVLANVAILSAAMLATWVRSSRERLGDILPRSACEATLVSRLGPALQVGQSAFFRDAVEVALTRSGRFSFHVGIVSLRWRCSDSATPQDRLRVRAALCATARENETVCFPSENRALLLATYVRSLSEVEEAQQRFAKALAVAVPVMASPLASGLAMSPMHGYTADDLIAMASYGDQPAAHAEFTPRHATVQRLPDPRPGVVTAA